MTEIIESLEIDQIIPDPNNRRIGGFDQKKLEQLADSIRAVGVQQPIVVREMDGQYQLVAGERRWKASKIAELELVPAVVRELSDLQVLKIQTIENLQREDVHPLDEADGYDRLLKRASYDVAALAKEVGKSSSYIYQRLKLLELVPEVREALSEGTISAGHAILIARLSAGGQVIALEVSLGGKYNNPASVRELDDYIQTDIMHDLSRAAFKKNDPELVPDAGACTNCPKRTGFNPDLFPEIQKQDKCMDGFCYSSKLDAFVDKQRAALKEEKTDSFEAIESGGGYSHEDQQKNKQAVEGWNWDECKKKDPEAKRVLIVAGPNRGRLTYGKKTQSSFSSGYEKTPEEKEKEREERRQEKIGVEVRRRVWHGLMDAVEGEISYANDVMTKDMLTLCLQRIADRLWQEYQRELIKAEGWEIDQGNTRTALPKKIAEMSFPELQLFLYKIALISDLKDPSYDYSRGDRVDKLMEEAAAFAIDARAIRAAVEEEMQPKKKSKERVIK